VGIKCLEDTLNTVLRRSVCGGYIVVLQTNGRSGSYNPGFRNCYCEKS
jgi:hypothetical protein